MRVILDRVTKAYGPVRALDDVTLEVDAGQIVALLGPNGAGKSTLLRCLGGVAVPNRGMIIYDGQPFTRKRLDLRKRFCYLPEFPFLYPEMSVLRHVGMVLRLYDRVRDGIEELVVSILRDLDLLPLAEMPIGALSRGQMYKAALAGLVAVDADLWLLDEPFASGMDPDGIIAFKRLARDAAARGRTVIYTTQILDIAERFSDRACIIDRGSVRAYDRIDDLRGDSSRKDGVLEAIFRRLREERA